MNLELRMYGLVNYQLIGIQKGIQFGHAVVEYANQYFSSELYQKWATEYKTFILLNGGTTNTRTCLDDGLPFGSLNKHLLTLVENNINLGYFKEPDLGDQLTAIVFIVDERVFNKRKYLDFKTYVDRFYNFDKNYIDYEDWLISDDESKVDIANEWKEYIGGDKNVFLKKFLLDFNLA